MAFGTPVVIIRRGTLDALPGEAELGREDLMKGMKAGSGIAWRQLPLIVAAGLLIGTLFGQALKAYAPATTIVAAKSKMRP